MFDERVEETIAGFRFHALDDLAQRRVVGRGLGRELLRTHQREVRLDGKILLHAIDSSANPPVFQWK